jgi:hypothetical protein
MKPWSQLLFGFFVMVATTLVLSAVAILAALLFVDAGSLLNSFMTPDYNNPVTLGLLKYIQIVQSVGLFVIPPFILAYLYHGHAVAYLQIGRKPKSESALLAVFLLIVANPVINFLGELNSQMQLPHALSGLETWMRTMEDNAEFITRKFLNVDSFGALMINMLMVAIIPALGEELLFRGFIQKVLTEWSRSKHWGVWLSAILFSAIHFQFYGFIPRMLLGALFGYMLVWSGSLWLPILGHFVNNTIGVFGYFLIYKGDLSQNIEDFGTTPEDLPYILVAAVMTAVLLYFLFRIEAKNSDQLPEQDR